MKWYDLISDPNVMYSPDNLCKVVADMWLAASESGDIALINNLTMNMLNPAGVAIYLDAAGVVPNQA